MSDTSPSTNVIVNPPSRDHWASRWGTLIGVAITVVILAGGIVTHAAGDDSRLTSVERRLEKQGLHMTQIDNNEQAMGETVGEIKQQSADTNATVHTILDDMLARGGPARR